MKNIFIATDFSPSAYDASIYGVELAKIFDAQVHLFYGCNSTVNVPSPFGFTAADLVEESKRRLESQVALINGKKQVDLEMYISDGPVVEAIIENATKCRADIIICGMKSKAKALKKVFGSVVYSLINKSAIPLLVIPEGTKFRKPGHIALAVDLDPETSPATLLAIKKLGEKFYSKISVVNVLNQNYNEDEVIKFHPPVNTSELDHLYPRYEFPVGDNIAQTIHDFATEKNFDVIAVVPHKRKWMDRLFTESVTKNLISYTDLPVLVLPQNKTTEVDLLTNMEHIHEIWETEKIDTGKSHA